jgi:hypothetical protein
MQREAPMEHLTITDSFFSVIVVGDAPTSTKIISMDLGTLGTLDLSLASGTDSGYGEKISGKNNRE